MLIVKSLVFQTAARQELGRRRATEPAKGAQAASINWARLAGGTEQEDKVRFIFTTRCAQYVDSAIAQSTDAVTHGPRSNGQRYAYCR